MRAAHFVLLIFLFAGLRAEAQHAHIVAGAESTQPGSKLFFVNGFQYVTNSGYVLYLSEGDSLYPNEYQMATTFTALPAGLWTGGPTLYAAEQGSHIEAELLYVDGPKDGEISFWQEDEFATTTSKVFGAPVGTREGTNRFNLSEGITFPDPDPFGHIHGRRFSASKPGLYTVGFRLIDTSKAGPGGGPIHVPSDPTYFHFQAGLTISRQGFTNSQFGAVFGLKPGMLYYLETTTNVAATGSWVTVAGPMADLHSDLHQLVDPTNRMAGSRFYRIRGEEQ